MGGAKSKGTGAFMADRSIRRPEMRILLEDKWLRQMTVITTVWFVLVFAAGLSLIAFAGAFATL